MIIKFLQPEKFSALRDNRVYLATDYQVFELPLQMGIEQAKTTNFFVKSIEISLKVFFAATSVGSLFMSIIFTQLLGMINGLQIQALTCLFRIRLPSNAMSVMITILNLAAFDMF